MQMPGRDTSFKGSYRYGFNGKEIDNETYGQGNEYDYGMRIYNPRVGRFLSVDPLTNKYPNETPYSYASNNSIRLIDANGQAASDPPFWVWFRETVLFGNRMMTNGAFQRAAESNGVPSTSPYLPRIGRIFEDAVLRSAGKVGMKKEIYPYPLTSPNTNFIPDAIEDYARINMTSNATTVFKFKDAIITDAKFTTENKIAKTGQIVGFIDYLADQRGVSINGVSTGEKNSDYGMASLVIATPSNVTISQDIIDYAKQKNVSVYQRIAVQVTSNGDTYSGNTNEQSAISNNKLKVSETIPLYQAPSKVNNFDPKKVTFSGGQGNGSSVDINWNQQ